MEEKTKKVLSDVNQIILDAITYQQTNEQCALVEKAETIQLKIRWSEMTVPVRVWLQVQNFHSNTV